MGLCSRRILFLIRHDGRLGVWRKRLQAPFKSVAKKLLRRSLSLYLWCIATTLLFALLALLFAGNPGLKSGGIGEISFLSLIREVTTFQFVYGWADFLQYYAVFMLFSPLAIWLLRHKLWYVFIALSVLIWTQSGTNIYLGWQLLFSLGMLFGFYRTHVESFISEQNRWLQRTGLITLTSFTLVTVVASFVFTFGGSFLAKGVSSLSFTPALSSAIDSTNSSLVRHFDKDSLPTLRILMFGCWFFTLYIWVRRHERTVKQYAGWLLMVLGRNSLTTYLMHSIVVFILPLFLPAQTGIVVNFLITTAAVLAVWLAVKHQPNFKQPLQKLQQLAVRT